MIQLAWSQGKGVLERDLIIGKRQNLDIQADWQIKIIHEVNDIKKPYYRSENISTLQKKVKKES